MKTAAIALTQDEHEVWNRTHYPGTRQICIRCGTPTGRCEEGSLDHDGLPYCETCYEEIYK